MNIADFCIEERHLQGIEDDISIGNMVKVFCFGSRRLSMYKYDNWDYYK